MKTSRRVQNASAKRGAAGQASQVDRIALFWTWFTASEHRFQEPSAEVSWTQFDVWDTIHTDLQDHLASIHPDMCGDWEVVDGRRMLVIGGSTLVSTPVILQTVAAAPALPGWEIFAFRLPADVGPVAEDLLLFPIDNVLCTLRLAVPGLVLVVATDLHKGKEAVLVDSLLTILKLLYGATWVRNTFIGIDIVPCPQEPYDAGFVGLDLLSIAFDNLKMLLRDWKIQDIPTTMEPMIPALSRP